MQKDQDLT
ncbi:Protein of unknown function [Streptococcus thermophilus]|nr:Protein of unknown function [Streptococcus thermophilus]